MARNDAKHYDIGIVQPELIYPRGAEKQVSYLAHHLRSLGHRVTLYTFEKSTDFVFNSLLEGVDLVNLGVKFESPLRRRKIFGWPLADIFLSPLRHYFAIRRLAGRLGGHDLINVHNHPAQWISGSTSAPVVWTCNEPTYWYYYPFGPKSRLAWWPFVHLDRKLTRGVAHILCLDHAMQKIVSEAYPQHSSSVLGSSVELERQVTHIIDDNFDILFVGALTLRKRPIDILKAVSIVKPLTREKVVVHMVGDGPLRRRLYRYAQRHRIDLRLYGSVSNELLYELYALADVAVFVPGTQPWGIFPLESLLAGVPTIISDECGVVEVLPNFENYIVSVGDTFALADRLCYVLKNRQEALHDAVRLQEVLSARYSWEEYARRFLTEVHRFLD